MDQPTNVTNAVVATTITVWGVATGLSYEVLLAGFAGGLVSLSFIAPMSLWQRIWTPFAATLTAGYTAQIGAHYLNKMLDGGVNGLTLLVFSAFAIGVLTQVLIPAAMKWVRRKAETLEGPTV